MKKQMVEQAIPEEKNVTIFQAILKAGNGDTSELGRMIEAATNERDNFVQIANQRIAAMNSQIELLQTLLMQATEKASGNNGAGTH